MKSSKAERYEKLIILARKGDESALEQLCREVEHVLVGYFSARYSNRQVVEELAQEAYLRLLKSFPRLKEPQKFSLFLAKIALHVHQEYLQNKYRNSEYTCENFESATIGRVGASITDLQPEVALQQDMDMELAFQHLPERTRRVLRMKLDGISYSEIATSLGTSVSAVKMIVNRGMNELKNYFKE